MHAASIVDRFVTFKYHGCEVDDDDQQVRNMIQTGLSLANQITHKIARLSGQEQIAKLEQLQANCHQQNFKYSFMINIFHAQLLLEEAQKIPTVNLQNTNQAIGKILKANDKLQRAKNAANWGEQKYNKDHV